jgi:hypothetical protein
MKNKNLIAVCFMLVISSNANAQLFSQLFNKAKESLSKIYRENLIDCCGQL